MPQRHIQKFSSADAIQSALNAGELGNPYVAFDQSAHTLDINTLTPAPPVETRVKATYLFESTEPIGVLNYDPQVPGPVTKAELADGTVITLTTGQMSECADYTPTQTGLTDIYYTISGTSLESNNIGGIFKNIGNDGSMVLNAKLVNVVIPDQITELGIDCFLYCKNLSAVTLPSGLTELPVHTFESCDALYTLDIPESVTGLGSSSLACSLAFSDEGILTFHSVTPPTFGQNVFGGDCFYGTVYAPAESVSDYETTINQATDEQYCQTNVQPIQ